MRELGSRRIWLGALCAAVLALGAGAAPAWGDFGDPLFVYIPPPPLSSLPPPTGYLDGPCGLAVEASGELFVSDYYHHTVDVFGVGGQGLGYVTQLANEDPLDGPCGLAFDAANDLYVNNYHRNVAKFNPSPSFGAGTPFPLPLEDPSHHLPTGVAVDPASGDVYVDNRTYISVYDSSGNPVEEGGEQVKIGLDPNASYYGLAISQFPGTFGYLYVPDAADNTVKVYDPALDKVNPVATLDGHATPNAAFTSLRDSAVAVDRVSGEIYVADNLQPEYTEQPQATIDVFDSAGAYRGHLLYNIVDALPPGLAVDNSTHATQGQVYVTSGNANHAGVYAYPPGAATTAPGICVPFGPCPGQAAAMGTAAGAGAGQSAAPEPQQVPVLSSAAVARAAETAVGAPRRHRAHRHRAGHRRHRYNRTGRRGSKQRGR